MKLISKFHDYYDAVAHKAREDRPVYVRTQVEYRLDASSKEKQNADLIKALGKVWTVFRGMPYGGFYGEELIGFCGKLYPSFGGLTTVDQIAAKVAIANKNPFNREENEAFTKGFFNPKPNRNNHYEFTLVGLKRFFNEFNPNIGDEAFLALGVPAFYLETGEHSGRVELALNPELKKLNFQKIFDSFSCFQELDQYLGNNMADRVNIEPRGITDELKAESHGYDKWSFRRHAEDDPKAVKRRNKDKK